MTGDTNLLALWATLPPAPPTETLAFSTAPVPGTPGVRIGRSRGGPALLFELDAAGHPAAPVELKNLAVRFNATCRVVEGDTMADGLFTVVTCTAADSRLHDLFLESLSPLLQSFAPDRPDAIARTIEALVELFRALSRAPVTSVLGLWGELFLIATGTDPDVLLDAWHQLPNDRYDFASGAERMEVKTTVGRRQHQFSLDQLRPPPDIDLWICSVVTESSAAGASIRDLIVTAAGRCKTPDASSRLVAAAAQALGSDVDEWGSTRYDTARARETLAFLPHHSVPRPGDPPPEVFEVRFVADISALVRATVAPRTRLVAAAFPYA